ncbi:hypothetical protein N2W23_002682 [Clostridium perfringens]|uniref:hypothetical protein n=1 Tax=Clostridium perfringens TaxID=1502 RepID=UPI00291128F9|nr:hypothetical protein [Clostridium perfringens]MDU4501237.1 hypothetical protein [Clostridium perfringens]
MSKLKEWTHVIVPGVMIFIVFTCLSLYFDKNNNNIVTEQPNIESDISSDDTISDYFEKYGDPSKFSYEDEHICGYIYNFNSEYTTNYNNYYDYDFEFNCSNNYLQGYIDGYDSYYNKKYY